MKKTITLLFLMFFVVGISAQEEYVMKVYQGTSATTYLVSGVDSMYFTSDGYTFSLAWPLDNYDVNNLALTADQMNAICTKVEASWADIKSGLDAGNIKLFAVKDGAADLTTSATSTDGLYFNASGTVCAKGAEGCAFYVKGNTAGSTMSFDFNIYPYENTSESPLNSGDNITVKFAVGETEPIIFSVYVTVQDAGTIVWNPSYAKNGAMTYDANLQPNNDYKTLTITLDSTEIATALGLATPADLRAGLADSTVVFYGVNADGSLYTNETTGKHTTANNNGCWYSADGNVCVWGTTAAVFVESLSSTDIFNVHMGEYPKACAVDNSFVVKQAYVKPADGKQAIITYNIKIVGK